MPIRNVKEKTMMAKRISRESGSDAVDAYIARCPKALQRKLEGIRAAIKEVAPDATERTSYFQLPGYYYPGYDYNGMFVWFGLQKSYISFLLRPPTIQDNQKELIGYTTTKAAVHIPLGRDVPIPLVKKLVRASLKIMKNKSKKDPSSTPKFFDVGAHTRSGSARRKPNLRIVCVP
ncbi:MAG: DUF1801 domain-containing protein [Nitrososphaerota archaeon]|jgi:uncharacterized protein YdhG (YjbR/CyaY superfamily)|nr:DUF1801 domain-containing protein [Nitrososphaerota archaeon]